MVQQGQRSSRRRHKDGQERWGTGTTLFGGCVPTAHTEEPGDGGEGEGEGVGEGEGEGGCERSTGVGVKRSELRESDGLVCLLP